jgi:hypothetical protein
MVIASPAQPDGAIQLDCFVASLLAMTNDRAAWKRFELFDQAAR